MPELLPMPAKTSEWRGMVLQVFATDWAGINLDNAN